MPAAVAFVGSACSAWLTKHIPVVVLPTCPFPPLVWLAKAWPADHILIEGHENYLKQSWRNRFDIRAVNGIQTLTFHTGAAALANQPIQEVTIDGGKWEREHPRSLKAAYGNAPYGAYYLEEVINLMETPTPLLFENNFRMIQWTLDTLGWQGKLEVSTAFTIPDKQGLRGRFKRTKWPVEFPAYPQMFEDRRGFDGNLCALDLIFNLGPEAALYLEDLSGSLSAFPE